MEAVGSIEDELASDWGLTDVGPLETTYDGMAFGLGSTVRPRSGRWC